MEIKYLVNDAYKALLEDLKSGDTINKSGISDRPILVSEKAGKHRMDFIKKVHDLLSSGTISCEDANKATYLFGKKTNKIFWCKK